MAEGERQERVARTFVELVDTLVDDFDVVELTALLTERCVELLGASAAGLVLADLRGTLRLLAATSEAIQHVELFQLEADEGPCRDCYRTNAVVTVDDLAATDRWPTFGPVAVAAGFRSVTAMPLRLRQRVLGALNLFHSRPGGFDRADVATAQAFADVATIALIQHDQALEARALTEQLQRALDSRVLIEQAKGVVAERTGVTTDEAFARIRLHARSHGRRLSDVAREVVERRALPDLPQRLDFG